MHRQSVYRCLNACKRTHNHTFGNVCSWPVSDIVTDATRSDVDASRENSIETNAIVSIGSGVQFESGELMELIKFFKDHDGPWEVIGNAKRRKRTKCQSTLSHKKIISPSSSPCKISFRWRSSPFLVMKIRGSCFLPA